MFLMLLGTDVLEQLFGNMQQKNKSGFDSLDMIYMSWAIVECSRILECHPEWVPGRSKVMSRLCLDYSKPSNWGTSKLTVGNVNIPSLWEDGQH